MEIDWRLGRIHVQRTWSTKAGRIEDVCQPLLAKAGLPSRKYHATRHTFATWLL